MDHNEEIKKEVTRERSSVGDGEYQVAYNAAIEANPKAEGAELIRAIINELDNWR
jgi:hypothetical protein